MIAALFLGLLAGVSAAPQFYFNHRPPPPPRFPHHDHFEMQDPSSGERLFDAGKFWLEINSELSKFDDMLEEFSKHFPQTESTSGLQGNQYKVNIYLGSFEEKEVTVKAKEGLLMIQAVHKNQDGVSEKTYMDIRTLPGFVNPAGSWTYEGGMLRVIFPVKSDAGTPVSSSEATTEVQAVQTEAPKDREEMESGENENTNQDADVGLDRGDTEVLTNEIAHQSPVEQTTYAVDLSDEVEFVPVRY